MKYLLFLFPLLLHSQKEATQWRFGEYSGIDFTSGSAIVVNSGQMVSPQGYASIADSAGNLLFYTDGWYIWNKNNVYMASGLPSLGGSQVACQNALSIRKTGGLYYQFITRSGPQTDYIHYVLVDMTLAGGLGSVVTSPAPIQVAPTNTIMSPNIASTRHCNGVDHWVLAHTATTNTQISGNNFYAYLANSTSVSLSPTITTLGLHHTSYGGHSGYMKFSPNGRKLCVTVPYQATELYDFDNSTGLLSNRIVLDQFPPLSVFSYTDPTSWGVEFSPDGSKLYITYANGQPFLSQFDLCAGSATAIIASKNIISTNYTYTIGSSYYVPAIQLAPDGKIYVAEGLNTQSLSVISNPNNLGSSCNYSPNLIYLGVKATNTNVPCKSAFGFPNFQSNYFEQKPVLTAITSTASCGTVSFTPPTITVCAATGYAIQSYSWDFGDKASGTLNTSTLSGPTHTYSQNGSYQVKAYANLGCRRDSAMYTVNVTGLPEMAVTSKTTICKGEKNLISVTGVSSYSLNGATVSNPTISVQPTVTTVYTITTGSVNCISARVFTTNVAPCNTIDESTINTRILLYPNPVLEVLHIKSNYDGVLEIYDNCGKLVWSQSISRDGDLHVGHLSPGLYCVRVGSAVGRFVKD